MELAHVHCDLRQCHLSIVWTLPLNWVALIANQPLPMRAFSVVIAGGRGGSRERAAIQVFELEPEQLRYAELTAGIDR